MVKGQHFYFIYLIAVIHVCIQTCLQPIYLLHLSCRSRIWSGVSRNASSTLINSQQECGRSGAVFSSVFAHTFWVLFEYKMPVCVSCPSAASTGMAEGHAQFQYAFKFDTSFVRFHGTCDQFEHFTFSRILSIYLLEKGCWLGCVLKAVLDFTFVFI